MSTVTGATTSGELRAHNRARLLRAIHDCGASRTRSQLTRDLELARGTASVLVGGLIEDALLHEAPAPEHTRGRPTQIPGPHPAGPLALAVDLREDSWTIAACELGGHSTVLETRSHRGSPGEVLSLLGAALRHYLAPPPATDVGSTPPSTPPSPPTSHSGPHPSPKSGTHPSTHSGTHSSPHSGTHSSTHPSPKSGTHPSTPSSTPSGTPPGALGPISGGPLSAGPLDLSGVALGPRVVGVGVAVAGPIRDGRIADVPHLGWRDVDVPGLLGMGDLPVYVGNDAALAALAEARRGRLLGVGVGLHLHVDFDVGGALVIDGRPLGGARGTAGEFGHMPLTGAQGPCMCGASGCWGLDVGSNALLRHLGLPAGYGRGRDQAEHILAQATQEETPARNNRDTPPRSTRTPGTNTPLAEVPRLEVQGIDLSGSPAPGTDELSAVLPLEAMPRTATPEADTRSANVPLSDAPMSDAPPSVRASADVPLAEGALPGSALAAAAVAANARALGIGIGALVNANDPEIVTLSGLGVDLHTHAGDAIVRACLDRLMTIRRERPPDIVPSALGWRGPLVGAMESVFDAFLTPAGLDAWRRRADRLGA